MRDFTILERCEHYFRCYLDNIPGKHCRILIDEHSQDLPIGSYRLHVENITDRYQHFGRDSVFRLTLPFSEQDSIEICTLNTGKKNSFTYRECIRLGGKWEPVLSEWVFSASVQEQVEKLRKITQSEPVTVEVEFKENITQPSKSLTLFGFELVKGLNINLTPIFHRGVLLKKGDVSFISGVNSKTVARAGTVIRLTVPKLMLESEFYREDYLVATKYRIIRRRSQRRPN